MTLRAHRAAQAQLNLTRPGLRGVGDDEEANRVTLERIIQREGWEVMHAPDGRAGIDRLRREPVDVVLTDLKMPGMSGLELLRAVKSLSPDVEVIAVSYTHLTLPTSDLV